MAMCTYVGGGAFVIFLSRVYQARDISHPVTGVSKRKGHCQMPTRELFYSCSIDDDDDDFIKLPRPTQEGHAMRLQI